MFVNESLPQPIVQCLMWVLLFGDKHKCGGDHIGLVYLLVGLVVLVVFRVRVLLRRVVLCWVWAVSDVLVVAVHGADLVLVYRCCLCWEFPVHGIVPCKLVGRGRGRSLGASHTPFGCSWPRPWSGSGVLRRLF